MSTKQPYFNLSSVAIMLDSINTELQREIPVTESYMKDIISFYVEGFRTGSKASKKSFEDFKNEMESSITKKYFKNKPPFAYNRTKVDVFRVAFNYGLREGECECLRSKITP